MGARRRRVGESQIGRGIGFGAEDAATELAAASVTGLTGYTGSTGISAP